MAVSSTVLSADDAPRAPQYAGPTEPDQTSGTDFERAQP